MSKEEALAVINRQYLPERLWGAVEGRIMRQNQALAAPIVGRDEMTGAAAPPGLLGMSAAIGNLTHELDLDRPVYWCVTRTPVVNAMIAAYRSPDMYVVVVAKGVLDALFMSCNSIMASEPLAAFLQGNVDPVDEFKQPERTRREAWGRIANIAEPMTDPEILERAFPLIFLASHFLMAHEVAHLAGGHLAQFSGSFAVEAGSTGAPGGAASRAFERDADALAAGATTYLLGNPEFAPTWSQNIADQTASLRQFFVAIYVLYSVMDLFGPEDALAEDRTHPPAMVRAGGTAMMLGLLLGQFGGFNSETVWDIARRAIRAVEIAVMELGGGIMDSEEASLLHAANERGAIEQAEIWPDLSAKLDRRHLKKYWWAQPLR